jgi:hypothetical protein
MRVRVGAEVMAFGCDAADQRLECRIREKIAPVRKNEPFARCFCSSSRMVAPPSANSWPVNESAMALRFLSPRDDAAVDLLEAAPVVGSARGLLGRRALTARRADQQ